MYTLPEALLAWRRLRLTRVLGHDLIVPPPSGDLPNENRAFLLQQAEELYWEELSWERLTGDEGLGGRGLVELAFPAFLAFVEGLLLAEATEDSRAPARPRPEVVEDILAFLAGRWIVLEGDADREHAIEREATLRLIDLVLYRLHGVDVHEAQRLELAWAEDDE
jgi:hypothetical protein